MQTIFKPLFYKYLIDTSPCSTLWLIYVEWAINAIGVVTNSVRPQDIQGMKINLLPNLLRSVVDYSPLEFSNTTGQYIINMFFQQHIFVIKIVLNFLREISQTDVLRLRAIHDPLLMFLLVYFIKSLIYSTSLICTSPCYNYSCNQICWELEIVASYFIAFIVYRCILVLKHLSSCPMLGTLRLRCIS